MNSRGENYVVATYNEIYSWSTFIPPCKYRAASVRYQILGLTTKNTPPINHWIREQVIRHTANLIFSSKSLETSDFDEKILYLINNYKLWRNISSDFLVILKRIRSSCSYLRTNAWSHDELFTNILNCLLLQ